MNILAINPWVYDFAAYDFWLKPYGFLSILTYLKTKGIAIDYFDCLDEKITGGTFGRGKYRTERIAKPAAYQAVPRQFKRYGQSPQKLINYLKDKNPDLIVVSSAMTYWYPAIIDLVDILKTRFPRRPIALGGVYATLCYQHAKENIACDLIYKNSALPEFFKMLGVGFDQEILCSTLPEYEYFYRKLDYAVLKTSWGCPFNCSYCASAQLAPQFLRVPRQKVIDFVAKYAGRGLKDFVLYDDAFLYGKDYSKKLLKAIARLKLKLRFHTPNALHLKFLDGETAFLLKQTGFQDPRFGLETLNARLNRRWGGKVDRASLLRGVNHLKQAGFRAGEFSLYLLLGYPGQNLQQLKKEAVFLNSLGAKISLAEFSPVPQTALFEKYRKALEEPLLHNNSIFGFFPAERIGEISEVKNYVRKLNAKVSPSV